MVAMLLCVSRDGLPMVERARQEAKERVRHEAAARQAFEARVAELEARLQALEGDRSSPPTPPADAHS